MRRNQGPPYNRLSQVNLRRGAGDRDFSVFGSCVFIFRFVGWARGPIYIIRYRACALPGIKAPPQVPAPGRQRRSAGTGRCTHVDANIHRKKNCAKGQGNNISLFDIFTDLARPTHQRRRAPRTRAGPEPRRGEPPRRAEGAGTEGGMRGPKDKSAAQGSGGASAGRQRGEGGPINGMRAPNERDERHALTGRASRRKGDVHRRKGRCRRGVGPRAARGPASQQRPYPSGGSPNASGAPRPVPEAPRQRGWYRDGITSEPGLRCT